MRTLVRSAQNALLTLALAGPAVGAEPASAAVADGVQQGVTSTLSPEMAAKLRNRPGQLRANAGSSKDATAREGMLREAARLEAQLPTSDSGRGETGIDFAFVAGAVAAAVAALAALALTLRAVGGPRMSRRQRALLETLEATLASCDVDAGTPVSEIQDRILRWKNRADRLESAEKALEVSKNAIRTALANAQNKANENAALEQRLKNAERAVNDARAALKEHRADQETAEKAAAELRAQVAKLEQAQTVRAAELETAQKSLQDFKERAASLAAEAESLKKRLSEGSAGVVEDLSKKLADAVKAADEANCRALQAENARDDATRANNGLREERDAAQAALQAGTEANVAEVNRLNESLKAAQAAQAQAEGAAERTRNEAAEELKKAKALEQALRDELAKTERRAVQAETRVAEEKDAAERRLETLRLAHESELRIFRDHHLGETTRIQGELDRQTADRQTAETLLTETQNLHNAQLSTLTDKHAKQVGELTVQVAQLESALAGAKSELEAQRQLSEGLEKSLSKQLQNIEAQTEKTIIDEEKITLLTYERDALRTQIKLNSIDQNATDIDAKLQSANEKSAKAHAAADQIQEQSKAVIARLAQTTADASAAQEEVHRLRANVAEVSRAATVQVTDAAREAKDVIFQDVRRTQAGLSDAVTVVREEASQHASQLVAPLIQQAQAAITQTKDGALMNVRNEIKEGRQELAQEGQVAVLAVQEAAKSASAELKATSGELKTTKGKARLALSVLKKLRDATTKESDQKELTHRIQKLLPACGGDEAEMFVITDMDDMIADALAQAEIQNRKNSGQDDEPDTDLGEDLGGPTEPPAPVAPSDASVADLKLEVSPEIQEEAAVAAPAPAPAPLPAPTAQDPVAAAVGRIHDLAQSIPTASAPTTLPAPSAPTPAPISIEDVAALAAQSGPTPALEPQHPRKIKLEYPYDEAREILERVSTQINGFRMKPSPANANMLEQLMRIERLLTGVLGASRPGAPISFEIDENEMLRGFLGEQTKSFKPHVETAANRQAAKGGGTEKISKPGAAQEPKSPEAEPAHIWRAPESTRRFVERRPDLTSLAIAIFVGRNLNYSKKDLSDALENLCNKHDPVRAFMDNVVSAFAELPPAGSLILRLGDMGLEVVRVDLDEEGAEPRYCYMGRKEIAPKLDSEATYDLRKDLEIVRGYHTKVDAQYPLDAEFAATVFALRVLQYAQHRAETVNAADAQRILADAGEQILVAAQLARSEYGNFKDGIFVTDDQTARFRQDALAAVREKNGAPDTDGADAFDATDKAQGQTGTGSVKIGDQDLTNGETNTYGRGSEPTIDNSGARKIITTPKKPRQKTDAELEAEGARRAAHVQRLAEKDPDAHDAIDLLERTLLANMQVGDNMTFALGTEGITFHRIGNDNFSFDTFTPPAKTLVPGKNPEASVNVEFSASPIIDGEPLNRFALTEEIVTHAEKWLNRYAVCQAKIENRETPVSIDTFLHGFALVLMKMTQQLKMRATEGQSETLKNAYTKLAEIKQKSGGSSK